jgi:hypothetical protein
MFVLYHQVLYVFKISVPILTESTEVLFFFVKHSEMRKKERITEKDKHVSCLYYGELHNLSFDN